MTLYSKIKVHIVKAMIFPVVMYRCESWTIKKAERQRIDAFKLWCWRRLLRVPWTARRSNQSILKEINPEYSLEGLMLKLQYFARHGLQPAWFPCPSLSPAVCSNSSPLSQSSPLKPSNHLILCCPLLFLHSILPSIRVFSNESALCLRWP